MIYERNPFTTRATRPGEIPYCFPTGFSTATLLACLEQSDWNGQIIGPHGSGKSTLLHLLAPQLNDIGRNVVWLSLNSRYRCLGITSDQTTDWTQRTQLIVDGYEQLSWWSRWRFQALCHRKSAGLLVTTHRSMGLPIIWQTNSSVEILKQIVDQLWPSHQGVLAANELARIWSRHGGNIRETLFELYDRYEARTCTLTK